MYIYIVKSLFHYVADTLPLRTLINAIAFARKSFYMHNVAIYMYVTYIFSTFPAQLIDVFKFFDTLVHPIDLQSHSINYILSCTCIFTSISSSSLSSCGVSGITVIPVLSTSSSSSLSISPSTHVHSHKKRVLLSVMDNVVVSTALISNSFTLSKACTCIILIYTLDTRYTAMYYKGTFSLPEQGKHS